MRGASVDAPESLDRAFLGASAVSNCGGPFHRHRSANHRSRAPCTHPLSGRGCGTARRPRRLRAVRRRCPPRGHRHRSRDGVLRRIRRPLGHSRDGDWQSWTKFASPSHRRLEADARNAVNGAAQSRSAYSSSRKVGCSTSPIHRRRARELPGAVRGPRGPRSTLRRDHRHLPSYPHV